MPPNFYGSALNPFDTQFHRSTAGGFAQQARGGRSIHGSRTRTEDQQPNEKSFGAVGRRAMAPPIIVPASIASPGPSSATDKGSSSNAGRGPSSLSTRLEQHPNQKPSNKRRSQHPHQQQSSTGPSSSSLRPNPASSSSSSNPTASSSRYGPYARKANAQPTILPLNVRPKPKKHKSFQKQQPNPPPSLNAAVPSLPQHRHHPLPPRPENRPPPSTDEEASSISAIPVAASAPFQPTHTASSPSSNPAPAETYSHRASVHLDPPPIPSLTDDLVDLSLSTSTLAVSSSSSSSSVLIMTPPDPLPVAASSSSTVQASARQPSLPILVPKLESMSPLFGNLAVLPPAVDPPDIKPRLISPSPVPSSSADRSHPHTSGALRFSLEQLPPATMTTDKALISMRKAARKAFIEEAVRTLGNESKRTAGGAKWRDDGVVLDWYLDEKSGTRWSRWPRKGMSKKEKEAFRGECRKALEADGPMEIVGVKDVPGDRGVDLKWKRKAAEPAEASGEAVARQVEERTAGNETASGSVSASMTGIEVPTSNLSENAKGKQPVRTLLPLWTSAADSSQTEHSNPPQPSLLRPSVTSPEPCFASASPPASSDQSTPAEQACQLSEEEAELLELEATERRAKELKAKIARRERQKMGLPLDDQTMLLHPHSTSTSTSAAPSEPAFPSTSSSFYPPPATASSHSVGPSSLRRPNLDSQQHNQEQDNIDVLVTRLPADASELEVRRFLGVLIVVEYQRLASHALVTFETERAALDAVRLLDGQDLRPGVSVSLTLARRRARTPVGEGADAASGVQSGPYVKVTPYPASNVSATVANTTKRKHISPSPPFLDAPPIDNTTHLPSTVNHPSFDVPQPTKKSKSSRSSSLLATSHSTNPPGGSTTLLNTAASSSRVDSKLSMQISVLSRATTLGLEKKKKDKSRKVIMSLEKGMYIHTSMNGVIRQFDRDKQTLIGEAAQVPLTHGSSVEDIVVSGRRIIVGSSYKTKDDSLAKAQIFYLDLNGGSPSRGLLKPINDLAHSKGVVSLATIPQTALDVEYASGVSSFASGGMDHCVKLWSIDDDDNHSVRNVHQTHSARVDALAFSEGKGWLMSGGADGRVVAYDLAAQRSAAWAIPKSSSTPVLHVHLSSTDPNLVLIEIRNNNLQYRIWDVRTPSQAAAVITFGDPPTAMTSSSAKPAPGEVSRYERGSFLRPLFAKGSADGAVKVWDMRNPQQVQQLPLHTTRIQQVLFDGPDRLLDVSADELFVRRYGLVPGKR